MNTLVDGRRDLIGDYFMAQAAEIDAGAISARDGLAHLGRLELLDLGSPSNQDGRLSEMSHLLAVVAEHSMASAFSLWAHHMVIEYLLLVEEGHGSAENLERLRSGELPGATAMATALQHELGLGDLGITAERHGDELRLDGKVRWASNLYPDGFLVVLAAGDGEGRRFVVAVPSEAMGVTVDPYPELLALGSTASSSLNLSDVRISTDHILSENVSDFLTRMRGPFLLLQSSFCVGLARAALREARGRITGVNASFGHDLIALEDRFSVLVADLEAACGRTSWHEVARDVLILRLEASTVARDAVGLEARVQGGAGYRRNSATARRIREAAFLPIQSPTEGLLRWELSCSNS